MEIRYYNRSFKFGFGQLSDEPLDYIKDCNGSLLLQYLTAQEPNAEIINGEITVKVYSPFEFVLRVESNEELIDVPWTLINTASPLCCVETAKMALRLNEEFKRKTSRLQAWRKALGLTQAQLAGKAGVNPRQIANFECGNRQLSTASFATVRAIASALKCKPEDLV